MTKRKNIIKNSKVPIVLSQVGDTLQPTKRAKEVRSVLEKIGKEFPVLKHDMGAIDDFKEEFEKYGFVSQWWNKSDMQEKQSNLLFLLSKSSRLQIDSIEVLIYMSGLLNQQQTILNQQQKNIAWEQEQILKHQEQLKSQNSEIRKVQHDILENSGAIHNSATVLNELRTIGMEHDNSVQMLNQAVTEIQALIRRLSKQIIVVENNLNERIDKDKESIKRMQQNWKEICNAVQNINW